MKLLSVVVLLLVPMWSSCSCHFPPEDCSAVYDDSNNTLPSGVYTIYPIRPRSAVQVYCDMDSHDRQWTVFQRRMDGSVNFYRPWDQYRMGFGNAAGEYWLGLENIFQLTRVKKYELLVDMEDFEGNKAFARYSSFSIDQESSGYMLHVSGFTNGGAGDSLSSHNGHKFSTFDKDQDTWDKNCAKTYVGAFWYAKCHHVNANGVYRWGADNSLFAVGVVWKEWKGFDYSLKAISMKIHPVQ